MQWQSATIFNCKQANIYYFLLQKVDFVRIWRTKVGGMEWLSNKSEGDASYSSPPSDTRLPWINVYFHLGGWKIPYSHVQMHACVEA